VTLKCSRSKFTLRGLPAVEFPELPQAGPNAVRLKADDLVKGIKQTAFAAGGEDKAVISGLFLSVKDGQMEIVATDGYRLAWRKAPVSDPTAELNVIVPKRAMDELARQVGAAGAEEVAIAMSNNQIALSFDDRYMTSRLVDGQYPPFRQIVPTTFACEAVLDRASLLGAVERVSIMAFDREAHIIKLEFGIDELKLSAGNSELGDSTEVVALEYTGEPMAISFNADFLVDALKNMDAETIRLGLNTPLSPVIIRPLDDDSHTCLLMPVNRV
jgi:DNA polymerase-3 subunit beta